MNVQQARKTWKIYILLCIYSGFYYDKVYVCLRTQKEF